VYTQSLSGHWQFRQAGSNDWLSGRAPGGVHTDLLALGAIPDPFVGDNEKRVQWVAETDWEYCRTFPADAALLAAERVLLVCDGLDTLATVTLNGQVLGKTDNMFRRYEWDVKPLLAEGENRLSVAFDSPVRHATEKQAARPMAGVSQAIPGGPHLRKAPCQWGWDWGPMLPPVGIWKDIRLEGRDTARLSDVHLRQQHASGQVTVSAKVTVEQWSAAGLSVALTITGPDGAPDGAVFEANATAEDGAATVQVAIPNPQLWWPNGYGSQSLYDVQVTLTAGETVLDAAVYRIGLRTIELRQQPDEWGKSWQFVVNGVPIFAKGSNWIPADSFPTRISDAYLEGLIRSAAESHQNMLRVWGGGLYEEERFYDLCERYGVLVWQEFMFSCSIYPLDEPAFVENVEVEARQNIRRIRHRASLCLWCGNNEMEWGWAGWGWNRPDQQDLKAAYDKFFHHTLPAWVAEEDPDTGYWPSSPSSDTPFEDPNGEVQGDSHYWDVWHGRKPFTAYRTTYPRFQSEFGFQSLPPLPTIRTYAEPQDWNMTSYIMEHHQRNFSGNGLMIGQMTDTFRMPKDFPSLVYLSMLLQAEGIRYGVEHWRRFPERVAGTLYWQLNDCWPVASWSSLDFFGRWKALHYTARRFYAPVLLSIADRGGAAAEGMQEPWLLTPADWGATMGLHVTNDTMQPWQGTVRWTLETLQGKVIEQGRYDLWVSAGSAKRIAEPNFARQVAAADRRELVFVAELWQGDRMLARQLGTFTPNKHLALVNPGLDVSVYEQNGRFVFTVTATSLARFVELALDGVDVVFSDNYFDVPAGRAVTVTCAMPNGLELGEARAALRVRSLYDSFA
jgi:beta-mannosidase